MRYFISYTTEDQSWAEWIAWQVESFGHEAIVQAWDFLAGSNFVLEMQDACSNSDATIIVLSKAFIEKKYPAAEWAEAFSKDPTGKKRILIPVKVDDVKPSGLLSSIVYIDLNCTSSEAEAVARLNQGINIKRGKPSSAPYFPNGEESIKKPLFPIITNNSKEALNNDLNIEIEINLNQEYDQFTQSDQNNILNGIKELLKTRHSIRIVNVRKGSVILTINLKREDALKLTILKHLNKLEKFIYNNNVTQISNPFILHMTFNDILREYNSYQKVPMNSKEQQKGTVVFIDEKSHEGLVYSEYGMYLKFKLDLSDLDMSVGSKIEYTPDNVFAFEILKPVHKLH